MQVLLDQNYFPLNYEKDKMHLFHLIFNAIYILHRRFIYYQKKNKQTRNQQQTNTNNILQETFFFLFYISKRKS